MKKSPEHLIKKFLVFLSVFFSYSVYSDSYKYNLYNNYGIVGTIGSSKTTLLNILAGIEKQTSGTVLYENNSYETNWLGKVVANKDVFYTKKIKLDNPNITISNYVTSLVGKKKKIIQNRYFNDVVANLFEQEKPSQILFSYFKNEIFLGYGGLVHINWIDRNAEISFVMKTDEQQNNFEHHWLCYLELIEKIAFEELNLHKLFVYAFDLRPHLYIAVEKSGYKKEAILKEHCLFDGKYIDVVIHSKIIEI